MSQPRTSACPTCRRRGDWFAGRFGPFCSHRCRLIDLGKWLGGEHVIPTPLQADHFAAYEQLPMAGNPDHAGPE
jgi:endogenous inhibitor of DNA gyrase (YacG/DUF329 family)